MPTGPNGQKRPADMIGLAVHVARIATGEIEEDISGPLDLKIHGREGGEARARALDPAKRKLIAGIAASSRWQLGRA